MTDLALIDAQLLADLGADFPAEFTNADPRTQTALVGYLNTYAGPWGCKASEEDALLGILAALWPHEWAADSVGIARLRASTELEAIADELADDAPVATLVARIVGRLDAVLS